MKTIMIGVILFYTGAPFWAWFLLALMMVQNIAGLALTIANAN